NHPARARAGASQGGVSAHQLGATLRTLAERCLEVGHQWAWEPAPDSMAAKDWGIEARSDAMARTLAEADVQAVILLRSALEHAIVTAQGRECRSCVRATDYRSGRNRAWGAGSVSVRP